MHKSSFIFDLDGTLWNSCNAILPAWEKVMKAHGVKRGPVPQEEMNSYMGKTVEQIAPLMLPELPLQEAIQVMIEGCQQELADLRKNGAILYGGVLETLRELSKNYNLFIVSNSQDGYVQAFVDHYELNDIICDIEMAGRTGKSKGENIKLIIKRNNLQNAVYVGDTIMDEEAARIAQIPFIFCEYGFGKAESPDYIIGKPSDLLNVAKEHFE